jgi:hypothetical protein
MNKASGSMSKASGSMSSRQGSFASDHTPEKVSAAAGADEALQAEVGRFNDLQDKLALADIRKELGEMEAIVDNLPSTIQALRDRGYVFKSYLEKKAETLATQWRDLRPRVEAALQTQLPALQREASSVQMILQRGSKAGPTLSTLESRVEAAIRSLEGMYKPLEENVTQTKRQVDDITWTLQQVEQASFTLVATEAPVEAVPANWKKPDDKDGVDGVLYLTDQRLVFEQKEEVATKKVLFVTTAKQKLQSLQWAVPVAEIDKAVGSKRGFMGKDDFLTISLTTGRPFSSTDVHLKGETGEAWQGFIGRVKSGDVAKERTVPVDVKAVETVSNAPTKCNVCGATLTQTVLRGQTEITCEYCGSKIRL